MKITAIHVENYKRIREIALRPEADRTLLLIGGRNAQGKTSLLDALNVAFGGKAEVAADPVRHGADLAEIRVELDNGALTIRRRIAPDGESLLEVREDGVKARAPQALLDKLIGARFLDPLAFLAMDAKKQRAQILAMVGDAERLAALDAKRAKAFDARRDHGRDVAKLEAQLAGLPEVAVGEVDLDGAKRLRAEAAELNAAERAATEARHVALAATSDRNNLGSTLAAMAAKIAEMQARHADLSVRVGAAIDAAMAAEAAVDRYDAAAALASVRRAQLVEELEAFDVANREHGAKVAAAARRAQVASELDALREKVQIAAAAIGDIDQRKAEILAAAKLPVPGLSIGDDGVTLNGVPFAQSSGAERLRVAMALAMSTAPGLRDVWVRDGALLDEESLAAVEEMAERLGVRVWLERVGAGDPGAIIIRDGGVA